MAKMAFGKSKAPGRAPAAIVAIAPGGGGDPAAGGPDLSAVGNAASASKGDTGGGSDLQEFTVKKGDDGGVVVCETNVASPPAGRRFGASFPQQGTYTETPYAPDASQDAMDHVTDLLGQLGVSGDETEQPDETDQPTDQTGAAPAAAAPPPGGGGGGFTGGY